jgi:hypothetical protein
MAVATVAAESTKSPQRFTNRTPERTQRFQRERTRIRTD